MSERLLLDEMFAPAICTELARRGLDVVAVAGHDRLGGLPDDRILKFATADGRCLVTDNVRDFGLLRASWAEQGRPTAGLLYVNAGAFPRSPAMVKRIAAAIAALADGGRIPGTGGVNWLHAS